MREAFWVLAGCTLIAAASWVIELNLWPLAAIAGLLLVAGFFVFGPALIDGIWGDEQ